MPAGLNSTALAALYAREAQRFEAERPRSAALRARACQHLPHGVPMAWMAGLYPTAPVFAAAGEGGRRGGAR